MRCELRIIAIGINWNFPPVIECCDLRPMFIWPWSRDTTHSAIIVSWSKVVTPICCDHHPALQSVHTAVYRLTHFSRILKTGAQPSVPLFGIILWLCRSLFWRQWAYAIWAPVISLSQYFALQTLCSRARKHAPRARAETIKILFLMWQVVVLDRLRTVDCQYCDHLVSPVINQSSVQPNIFSTR